MSSAETTHAGDIHNLTEVDQAIRTGAQYESSRKWIDAIETYEKAVKLHPKNEELTYGLRRSRICFGIERRYTDASFTRSLPAMTRGEALQTLDDVLTKVQALYVEPITITKFLAHGTETLYWALTDTQFQESNIPVRYRADVNKLRAVLHDKYWNRQVASRAECVQVIDEICRQAQQTLSLHAGPVIMEFVFGGCNALDDYSGFLTPSRMRDLKGNINGQFVGLGVEMKAVTGEGLLLVNVIPDSPAEQGGLRSGEHIVGVDGRDVRESTTDQAASLMQGLEGSRCVLEIQGKVRKQPRKVTLTRRAVVVKSIPVAKILDGTNIGYIQMTGFQSSTAEELDIALRNLNSQGMRALIWDVRGNPGGLLQTAVQVLDRFITDGIVVSTKGRASDQNHAYPAYKTGTWTLPMVLLVDGDSASAQRDRRRSDPRPSPRHARRTPHVRQVVGSVDLRPDGRRRIADHDRQVLLPQRQDLRQDRRRPRRGRRTAQAHRRRIRRAEPGHRRRRPEGHRDPAGHAGLAIGIGDAWTSYASGVVVGFVAAARLGGYTR